MSTLLSQVDAICSRFPEVNQRLSHGSPGWFVRDKKNFVMLWDGGHHDHDFPHLWVASSLEEQAALIASNPAVFFRPPYVGHRGWVGVRLDGKVDWAEIGELCEEAYRMVAPKTLSARLDRD
ncbi:MmcQ/YjbR family DNA-binding protein [Hamadaea tsunoensis]|uniref:MmcQ/YjbR family DNA-binding protein n=1 Tax=Hamadaea tsunoensis TaxID=53368 RepID=UPI000427DC39|nr:MmcQ/YjbR family DNA-binding protein [Hamadaea tsunoensis]